MYSIYISYESFDTIRFLDLELLLTPNFPRILELLSPHNPQAHQEPPHNNANPNTNPQHIIIFIQLFPIFFQHILIHSLLLCFPYQTFGNIYQFLLQLC